MSKICLFLATTLSASIALADNSSCSENVRVYNSASESTLKSGPSVPLAQQESAIAIIKLIRDRKEKRVSDCEILNELKPLISKTK